LHLSLPAKNKIIETQRAAAGDQKAAIAREFGISHKTLYQYLRTNEAPDH